jgi:hypothetical protein
MDSEKIEHKKWQYVFEDENATYIWKYNSKINGNNPIEVEMKYKSNVDPSGKKVKRTKLSKK